MSSKFKEDVRSISIDGKPYQIFLELVISVDLNLVLILFSTEKDLK